MEKRTYFINTNGQQSGPFDLEQLRNQNLTVNTSIWCSGFSGWMNITEVPELKSLVQEVPPPFQATATVTPPPFVAAATTPNIGSTGSNVLMTQWSKLQPMVRYAVMLLIFSLFANVGYTIWARSEQRETAGIVVAASMSELKGLKSKLALQQVNLNKLNKKRLKEEEFHLFQFDRTERLARVDSKIAQAETSIDELKNQIEDIEKTIAEQSRTAKGE